MSDTLSTTASLNAVIEVVVVAGGGEGERIKVVIRLLPR